MKRIITLVVAVTVAALAVALASAAPRASSTYFAAKLTATTEIPPQKWKNPSATGSFVGEVAGSTMRWTLKFTGLTGVATAAIHLGAVGSSGRIVVPLCVRCFVPLTGTSTLSKPLLADLKSGNLYVNVETRKNPTGEIRGQL